jgi:hypothetical protein
MKGNFDEFINQMEDMKNEKDMRLNQNNEENNSDDSNNEYNCEEFALSSLSSEEQVKII